MRGEIMKFTRKESGKGPLFNHEPDTEAEGMNLDALAKSRDTRRKLMEYYKFDKIPESILVNDIRDKAIDLCGEKRGSNKSAVEYVKMRGQRSSSSDKDLIMPTARTVFKTQKSGSRKGSLSKFPQNVGRTLTNFYCVPGGTVYDPFAGHVSRMQLVYETGRNYIGVDVCDEFMDANEEVKRILMDRNKKSLIKNDAEITLIRGSSDKVDLPDECADFTITSPPYGFKGGIEYYGDEPEQLGNARSQDEFLKRISKHIIENARVLKDKSYCCWCVNDFVLDKVFHPYHAQLIPLFQFAGFRLHYIYIIDLGATIQTVFMKRIHEWKTFPKRHEYCLVFQKSDREEREIDYNDFFYEKRIFIAAHRQKYVIMCLEVGRKIYLKYIAARPGLARLGEAWLGVATQGEVFI